MERHSQVPWPLVVAAFLPVAAGILGLGVWWLRGKVWPLRCGYPTTAGRPCKIIVLGEWRKCRYHKRQWERLTDRHRVNPKLPRWKTYKRGQEVEQKEFYGRGF